MKKFFILFFAVLLTGCFSPKEKVEILPSAQLNTPYLTTVNFSDQRTYPRRLVFEIFPADSGLSVKSADDDMYDTAIISGTPKTKQDISIEIFYVIRGPVGFFESHEQSKYYKINVKE